MSETENTESDDLKEETSDDTQPIDDDTSVKDGDESKPAPPVRYNVSSYGWDSDVEGLVKRLKRGDIYVPGFQRGYVWQPAEKSRFIESLILGLPVPNVFLARDASSNRLNIVDGQQRLRTLQSYLEGEFYLSGNQIQDDLKGRYFSQEVAKSKSSKHLDDDDARALSDSVLHTIVIKPDPIYDDEDRGHEYNKAVIQIFRRLNTSGKALVAQEIRASIFYGALETKLRSFNEQDAWRELFGKPHSRLKDMELILRFIALREAGAEYTSPMPKFLDDFMENNRDPEQEKLDEIESAFVRVAEVIQNAIGAEGLRSGSTLTVSRLDAVMAGCDAYLQSTDAPNSEDFKARLKTLEQDKKYQWSIEEFVNDTDRVKARIERARAIFGAQD